MNNKFWKDKKVLVTGGASFIGSHLVEKLVKVSKKIVVIDNLSTGKLENMTFLKDIDFGFGDVLGYYDDSLFLQTHRDVDIVIHLANVHGGRGFIDQNEYLISKNLTIDHTVISKSVFLFTNISKIVFASSGCVYPVNLQDNVKNTVMLTEEMVGPPYNPDRLYGWAKLTAEMIMEKTSETIGIDSTALRFFTAYGPRAKEDHAVMAFIARTFVEQNPFEIWGDGTQMRNWTYVSDIVNGIIAATEKSPKGFSAYNLGTEESNSVKDAISIILDYDIRLKEKLNINQGRIYNPNLYYMLDKPVGVLNRICSVDKARKELGWEPEVSLVNGIQKTMDWYYKNKNIDFVKNNLEFLIG